MNIEGLASSNFSIKYIRSKDSFWHLWITPSKSRKRTIWINGRGPHKPAVDSSWGKIPSKSLFLSFCGEQRILHRNSYIDWSIPNLFHGTVSLAQWWIVHSHVKQLNNKLESRGVIYSGTFFTICPLYWAFGCDHWYNSSMPFRPWIRRLYLTMKLKIYLARTLGVLLL